MPDSRSLALPSPVASSRNPTRLMLKAGVPSAARVDGGWWPKSRDLTAELPPLLKELSDVIGAIAVVGYHLDGWDPAPDHLGTAVEQVHLQGFTAEEPHSVVVIAASGQRVTLLVIPPNSGERAAQQALADASAPSAAPDDDAEPAHATTDRSMAETVVRISRLEHLTAAADLENLGRWVDEAAQQFVDAPIQSFVPILVEHIVRCRLAASGHADLARGTSPRDVDHGQH